jgi:hypothetical protein
VVTGRAPLTGLNDWGAESLPLGPLNRIGSWRMTEASVTPVIRIASDASDHELEARALRSLERQTRLQGEAASGPARRPAGFAEEVVTVPRNELAQVTEAVEQDLTARPRVPLLFGGLASHDR